MSYKYRRNERLVFRVCAVLVVVSLLLAICAKQRDNPSMYPSASSAARG
jgi:hypothetical protein